MTAAEKYYHEISDKISGIVKGKMFGALCLKAPNGKAFAMFWKDFMVFKLSEKAVPKAMQIEGACLFDPMAGRPMNGWIHISFAHKGEWEWLAKDAYDFVRTLKAK